MSEREEPTSVERGIESPDVVDKYKAAADIANDTVNLLRRAAYAGLKIGTLCALGDSKIAKATAGVYTKAKSENGEKMEKGVAFPTCISVNNCASHFCPIETDPEAEIELVEGDVITVQLGVHIDGYACLTAQTLVVRASKDSPAPPALTGRQADAVVAAYTAAEALLRVMRPGKNSAEVTSIIEKAAKNYGVEPLEGVLSHQMKRYVIDGSKVISNKNSLEARVDDFEFEENEVYNIDVVMSTGDGKVKEMNTKETVYKRQVDVDYKLKLKTSRQVFSEINLKYPTMPFTLRALADPKRSRMAMTEMTRHSLVVPYPVLYEKEGEILARCSMTVLILPAQTMRLTSVDQPAVECSTELIDEDLKALLAISLAKKKKGKKKKKTGGEAAEDKEDGDAMET